MVAGIYVQAISALAPHPNAARLWMEYLYSGEAPLALPNDHRHTISPLNPGHDRKMADNVSSQPVQFRDYGKNADPLFPTIEEQEKARETITKGWESIVGVKMQCYPDDTPSGIPMVLNDTGHTLI